MMKEFEDILEEINHNLEWCDDAYQSRCYRRSHDEITRLRLERDALLARLAPMKDEALVEIAAKEFIEATTDMPPRTTYTISERSLAGARAAIAAIRPHIEAAERERCARIATGRYWSSALGSDGIAKAIAAEIRSGK